METKNNGWVAIHRSLQDHWLWDDKPFSKGQAWIDLIMLANHKERTICSKGQLICCKRGTVHRSILSLADRWGWNRKTATSFLKMLEKDEMVTVASTTQGTTITIVNYDNFQGNGATDGATDGQRRGQRWDINNNENNEKKDKKNMGASHRKQQKNSFHNFDERRIDYDAIAQSIEKSTYGIE